MNQLILKISKNLSLAFCLQFAYLPLGFADSSLLCKNIIAPITKSEIENRIIQLATIITIHSKSLSTNAPANNANFVEATVQINEILKVYPNMLKFYLDQLQKMSQDSSINKVVSKKADREQTLQHEAKIVEASSLMDANGNDHFIFKRSNGHFFGIGRSAELINFISNLNDVQKVATNRKAGLILFKDGKAQPFGEENYGGDSFDSPKILEGIQTIYSNSEAFALIKNDRTVITRGNPQFGGDSSSVQHLLKNVQKIVPNRTSFAALLDQGNVVTFGFPSTGGDSSPIQHLLKNIQEIKSTENTFLALREDNRIVVWGSQVNKEQTQAVFDQIKDVENVFPLDGIGYALLLKDKSLHLLHRPGYNNPDFESKLIFENINTVKTNRDTIVGVDHDGNLKIWSHSIHNPSFIKPPETINDAAQIFTNPHSVAILKNNGEVISFGYQFNGGNSSNVQKELHDIINIIELPSGFLALRKDGKYILWGHPIGEHSNEVVDLQVY